MSFWCICAEAGDLPSSSALWDSFKLLDVSVVYSLLSSSIWYGCASWFLFKFTCYKIHSLQFYGCAVLWNCTSFSSCPQSFPALGSFPVNQIFASGGQSIGPSASAAFLPMNCQCWFPLGLTGFISLLSKGLSRLFSSTTVWKHQFFNAQPSLLSNTLICTWILEKP